MNAKSVILVCGMWAAATVAWAQYAPAGDRIKTSWAEDMDVNRVWAEYPRPIMERTDWSNLNGLWSYAIEPKAAAMPRQYDGEILVPFAVESSLSGVQKQLGAKNELIFICIYLQLLNSLDYMITQTQTSLLHTTMILYAINMKVTCILKYGIVLTTISTV